MKFSGKVILLIIPWVIIIVSLILVKPSPVFRKSLFYAIPDKNRILKNTPDPKIVFIGGSNISFGLDSKRFLDTFHCNPINTGIHTSLGLKYMLSNAFQYIHKGDILIISAEYEQFYNDFADGEIELLSVIMEIEPGLLRHLRIKQLWQIKTFFPQYLISKAKGISEKDTIFSIGIYDRKSFNEFGDAVIHWNLPKQKVISYRVDGKLNTDIFNFLKNYQNKITKKQATILFTFPCLQDISYDKSVTKIKEVERLLLSNEFKVISTPEEYRFPDSLVYNTAYHLTKEGVEIRTTRLISDLQNALHGSVCLTKSDN